MWVDAIGAAVVAMLTVKRYRARVVDPDRDDPARNYRLLKVVLLALTAAVLVWVWQSASPSVLTVLVAALVYSIGVILIGLAAAARRRATGYAICEDSYASAPGAMKKAMRKIYQATAAIESSRAHRDGMFGDLDVERLAFSAAQRAVLSSELVVSTSDSARANGYTTSIDAQAAQDRQQTLLNEVLEVELSLARAESAAKKLSEDMEKPNRIAEAQRASTLRQQSRDEMRDRMDAVNARIDSVSALQNQDIEDRITSVQAGYTEAQDITNRTTESPVKQTNSDVGRDTETTPGHNNREKTEKPNGFGIGRVAKAVAARLGK